MTNFYFISFFPNITAPTIAERNSMADISKANKLLGYTVKVPVEEGFERRAAGAGQSHDGAAHGGGEGGPRLAH